MRGFPDVFFSLHFCTEFAKKNEKNCEHVVVYHYIVSMIVALLHRVESDTATEFRDYNFDMTALADHLRRQTEQNRNAAYFNIDILKYQVSIWTLFEFHCIFIDFKN